jgi:hypothetical protein
MVIPEQAINVLRGIARDYLEPTRKFFPRPNAWRQMSQDETWKAIVYQIVVVGGSASYERLVKSVEAQRALDFEHLRSLDSADRLRTINRVLRDHGVRYASGDLAKCHKSKAIIHNFEFLLGFPGGLKGYLLALEALPGDGERMARVSKDMRYIGLKGSRDLLAELGLVTEIIALDSRVLGILRALMVTLPPDLQSDGKLYALVERELLDGVCKPLGITGVQLDRILYRNYSAIRDGLGIPGLN